MIPRGAALLVIDVQKGFDAPGWGPRNNPADRVHSVSLANLHGEFATVVAAADVLSALARLTEHNS